MSVSGKVVAPDKLKAVPDKVAPLTMTAVVPLDVNVTGWIDGVPIGTLPKATTLELTVRPAAPLVGEVAATPVPANWIVVDGLPVELFAITNCADAAPAIEGAKWMFRVAVPFAANVKGSELKPS